MDRRLLTFVGIAFAFSWAIAAAIHLNGGLGALGGAATLVLLLYMCGPAVGALVCVVLFERGRRLAALGLAVPRWRELPWAWFGVVLLCVGALLFTLAVPGYGLGDPVAANIAALEQLPEGRMSEAERDLVVSALRAPGMGWVIGLSALVLGPLINWPLMLSEELGWRGYLWDRLEASGFWRASLVTGLLWGVWHAPIILMGYNYPTMPVLGVFVFTLFTVLFSPLYSWVRVSSRSVWGPALMHGTTNALAGYVLLWQEPVAMPMMGLLGGGGLAALVLANAWLWRVQRRAVSSPATP